MTSVLPSCPCSMHITDLRGCCFLYPSLHLPPCLHSSFFHNARHNYYVSPSLASIFTCPSPSSIPACSHPHIRKYHYLTLAAFSSNKRDQIHLFSSTVSLYSIRESRRRQVNVRVNSWRFECNRRIIVHFGDSRPFVQPIH